MFLGLKQPFFCCLFLDWKLFIDVLFNNGMYSMSGFGLPPYIKFPRIFVCYLNVVLWFLYFCISNQREVSVLLFIIKLCGRTMSEPNHSARSPVFLAGDTAWLSSVYHCLLFKVFQGRRYPLSRCDLLAA